jgi:MoxR-like ATPase
MTVTTDTYEMERQAVEQIRTAKQRLGTELAKVIVGQGEVIEHMLIAILCGGHCLITGAPGLAKTLLIKSLAQLFHLKFQRIQFTPDLMPADITGTEILQQNDGERRMVFVKGPVFANIILADEINRTPPKTQAALLEAMQEHHVTAAGVTHPLAEPFYVFATQNPIEMEGTYPLPEAQLDRFMFNVWIDYLGEDDEVAVVRRTTAAQDGTISQIFTAENLLQFNSVVRRVPIAEDVVRYAVRIAAASRPHADNPLAFVNEWVTWGAGLRASQFMVLGAKARALLSGQSHVTFDDIRALAYPVLRHRVLINYKAQAEGVAIDDLIGRLLESVKENAGK